MSLIFFFLSAAKLLIPKTCGSVLGLVELITKRERICPSIDNRVGEGIGNGLVYGRASALRMSVIS